MLRTRIDNLAALLREATANGLELEHFYDF